MKLSDPEKMCWLAARYNFTLVAKVCVELQSVPTTLTNNQRKKAVSQYCNIPEKAFEEMAVFIERECPSLLELFTPKEKHLLLLLVTAMTVMKSWSHTTVAV